MTNKVEVDGFLALQDRCRLARKVLLIRAREIVLQIDSFLEKEWYDHQYDSPEDGIYPDYTRVHVEHDMVVRFPTSYLYVDDYQARAEAQYNERKARQDAEVKAHEKQKQESIDKEERAVYDRLKKRCVQKWNCEGTKLATQSTPMKHQMAQS